jgi:hypothetical protein
VGQRHAAGRRRDGRCAFTGWVFLMRRHGQRLPARHVGEPIQGQVLLINRYEEEDRFYVRLYHPGQFMDWSHELHGARIERSNGGVHLLRGDEWVSAAKEHKLQTWLCVPTVERGYEILRKMAARERLS